jgi:hypothetical protein
MLSRTNVACVLLGFSLLFTQAAVALDDDKPDDALAQGLAAAKAQQFPLALEYFTAAYKADPAKQEIWFNLGLASSKILGHELRAMAFLKAYLLAVPDSPKHQAIRDLVTQLSLHIKSVELAILDELSAKLLTGADLHGFGGVCGPLSTLANREARAGFVDRALKTSHDNGKSRCNLRSLDFVVALADGGSLAQAKQTLASRASQDYDWYVNKSELGEGAEYMDRLMAAYARQDDLVDAEDVLAKLKSHSALGNGALLMACKQAHAGNKELARKTLIELRDAWLARAKANNSAQYNIDYTLVQVARALILNGDTPAAEDAMSHVQDTSRRAEYSRFVAHPGPYSTNYNSAHLFWLTLGNGAAYINIRRPEEECWFPEDRVKNLLSIGIEGVHVYEHGDETCSDTELTRCLALIKKLKGRDSLGWGSYEYLGFLGDAIADAYNFLRER